MSTEQKSRDAKIAPLMPFPSAHPSTLEWLQPSAAERIYRLRSGTDICASLTYRSAGGTFATAETLAGTWTFKRIGFLNPKITIRSAGSEEDVAVYRPHVWGDGKIIFPDGRTYVWKPTSFWSIEWSLIDPAGAVLLGIKPGLAGGGLEDLQKIQATMDFARGSSGDGLLPLFAAFGMYLFVIHQMDTAPSTPSMPAAQ